MKKSSRRCYCAFCRSPRTVYVKKHVGLADITLTGTASALLSIIVFHDLDPRLVVFFALGLGIAELFIMLRWRLSIACSRCGFDPVLYQKSQSKAAARVKAHLTRMRADPMSAFSPQPKLPHIRKSPSTSAPPPEASR